MQPQLIAGRYQVLRPIGRGGMGIVWLCRDEVLGREVAVKQIGALPGESANETKRAMREARSAAALNHANAVAVYDVVSHEERPWLVMEYVEGQTLAEEISRDGRLSPQRVADIGSQLAGALARAHERRIVHRDIKPGNVLLDRAGRPKISDFGIARGYGDDQLTQTGFVTGTPGYLSPELARGGDPDSASDVWALGATLYAAVEGEPPYEPRSNPIALLMEIATKRPRPMAHGGAIGPAIETMMHEDPTRRWDMTTSAQRLAGIARREAAAATAAIPRVDPDARAIVVPPLESTQRLAPPLESTQRLAPPLEFTQRLEATTPPLGSTQRLEATTPPLGSTQRLEASAPPLESTKRLEASAPPPPVQSTQRLEASAPPPVQSTQRLEASAPPPVQSTQRMAPPERPAVAAPVPAAPVPAAPVPAAPAPAAPVPVVPLPGDRKSPRRRLPLVLVPLLLAVSGLVFVLSQLGGQDATPGLVTGATTPAKVTATSAPTTAAPPVVVAPVPPATTAAPRTDARKQLAAFVDSYYSDVTSDTNSTWARLTPRMQQAAGGRSGYDGFWRSINKVRVNSTRVNTAATSAVVSLTFTSKSGATSTETHQFGFVNVGAAYRIDIEQR